MHLMSVMARLPHMSAYDVRKGPQCCDIGDRISDKRTQTYAGVVGDDYDNDNGDDDGNDDSDDTEIQNAESHEGCII